MGLVIFTGNKLFAAEEEEKSVDTLMGLSIQNYLEGNIKQTILYLDKLLTRQADNTRARDLMEKAVNRMSEDIKAKDSFEDMKFVEIGIRALPNSKSINENIEDLNMVIEKKKKTEEETLKEKKRQKIQKEQKQKEKSQSEKKIETKSGSSAKAKKTVVLDSSYKRNISRISSQIRNLEKNIKKVQEVSSETPQQMQEIGKRIESFDEKFEIERSRRGRITFWTIFILIFFLSVGICLLYWVQKEENSKLLKSLLKEKQALEDLKNASNRDTEELSKKLVQYGKFHMKAEEMEKHWQQVVTILDRLTTGGSAEKVVLKDSPDGRKAVTGVDPRVRARADSVEIIADIFIDSPRAVEMLGPFLDDRDNRTRANAAVAYYRYDPEKSMTVLQEMASSDDKWMRISAAWALGQIGDSFTSKVLEKLLDDDDTQVKNKARASFEKILEKNENESDDSQKKDT